jgi:hypothetical protein
MSSNGEWSTAVRHQGTCCKSMTHDTCCLVLDASASRVEGPPKNKSTAIVDGPPPCISYVPTYRLIFLDLFYVRFWAFLGKESKKNTTKLFEKMHKSTALIFSRFRLSHFWAFLGEGSSKMPL